jgi:hypothetical protein
MPAMETPTGARSPVPGIHVALARGRDRGVATPRHSADPITWSKDVGEGLGRPVRNDMSGMSRRSRVGD